MRRRDFVLLLGAWARESARAEPSGLPVIAYLNGATEADTADLVAAFLGGLAEKGYEEHQNVTIEYSWADNHYDRLPSLAAEAVHRNVSLIAATSTPVALAAQRATTTIPIVFSIGGDPVKFGLVRSLSRPGGNLTGVTRFNVDLVPKRLELLHELVPAVAVAALLVNPTNPNTPTVSVELEQMTKVLGVEIHTVKAETDDELEQAFNSLSKLRAGALVIANDPFFNSRSELLAQLATRFTVPTIYQYRKFVEAGGLLSYGASNIDSHHQLGIYAGRILAGEKPAELPVERSTKVDLIINTNTAKALGVVVPESLLARADDIL